MTTIRDRWRSLAGSWLCAAVVVGVAWLLGLAMWTEAEPDIEFREVSFAVDWYVALPLIAGRCVAVLAGLARGTLANPVARFLALAVATAILAWWAYFSAFGGFCMDPGDTCIVSPLAHATGLFIPVACLLVGLATEAVARNRRES